MARCRSSKIVVNADPATVFDVLSDPAQHALFDGSDSVKGQLSGPPRLYLGAKFNMRMRMVAPYLVRNLVVEYDEDRRIAWRHPLRHVWRYQLSAVDGGTEVTEGFDYTQSPIAAVLERLSVPERNQRAIDASLQRLKVLVESRTSAL